MNKGRKPVPVIYNGITYDSVYDCAAAFDLSANAVRWRLKHSLPLRRKEVYQPVQPCGSCGLHYRAGVQGCHGVRKVDCGG